MRGSHLNARRTSATLNDTRAHIINDAFFLGLVSRWPLNGGLSVNLFHHLLCPEFPVALGVFHQAANFIVVLRDCTIDALSAGKSTELLNPILRCLCCEFTFAIRVVKFEVMFRVVVVEKRQ